MPSLFMPCEGIKSNPGDLLLCEGRKSNPGDLLLCEASKSNPGDLLLCEASNSNPGDLLLCEGNKSNPRHTLLTCPPAATFYPFSTNNRSVPYPVCTAFSLYFPFQPRDRLCIQSLLLSPVIFSLNQVLDSCYNFPPFFVV